MLKGVSDRIAADCRLRCPLAITRIRVIFAHSYCRGVKDDINLNAVTYWPYSDLDANRPFGRVRDLADLRRARLREH